MDTFQIIVLVVIAVVFVAMVLLLFVGRKSSKKTTSKADKKKEVKDKKPEALQEEVKAGEIKTEKPDTPQEEVKVGVVEEESLEALKEEAKEEEAKEEEAKEEKKADQTEEKIEDLRAAFEKLPEEPSKQVTENEIVLESGRAYTVGEHIKAGVYNLHTLDGAKTADINLYGLDVEYDSGEKLVLSDGDVLIAKTPVKIKK